MAIQKATASDHEILTTITKESKAFWGYSDSQIAGWSEALTITKEYVETNTVYKLVHDKKIAAYYSFINEENAIVKLDNLFVLPEYIGKGFGKMPLDDFLIRIKATATNTIYLEADPNAEAFYTKFGFIKVGQIETSIQGRYLPVMELCIK